MWGFLGILFLFTAAVCLYRKRRPKKVSSGEKEQYSYRQLCHIIQNMLSNYIRESDAVNAVSADAVRNKEEQRREISDCIRNCNSGNIGAREVVKELIRDFLMNQQQLDETKMLYAVPFDSPDQMNARQLVECLIYIADKRQNDYGWKYIFEEVIRPQKDNETGMPQQSQSNNKNTAESRFIITEQMIRDSYNKMQIQLSFSDCIQVMTQLIYADTVGLGVIDSMNYQKGIIEEIQLGMNGYAEQNYNYREEMNLTSAKRYSKDSVHVLMKGNLYWLSFLSFGTEEELQRVLRNLIKDSRTGELTRIQPMTVIDTVDGRRVSVSRPPMTDTWVGLIRKFDSVTNNTIHELYHDTVQGSTVTDLLIRLLQSGNNIAITGEMASGKTTLLRALVAELPHKQSIRIIESESFELKMREFLPDGNSLTMRVTKQTPAEDVLAFARKTTGQIFVVGEVNSAPIASMVIDLSKIASQLLFSAHYTSTEEMITDFVNAKLCVGGYNDEGLAEQDVVRALDYDIHLTNKNGRRYIEYIHKIVPDLSKKGNTKYHLIPVLKFEEEERRYQIFHCGI